MKKLYLLAAFLVGAIIASIFLHQLIVAGAFTVLLAVFSCFQVFKRTRSEDAARYFQSKYNQLATNATIGICIAAPDGKMSFVSNQVLAITGNMDLEDKSVLFESLFPEIFQPVIRHHFAEQLENDVHEIHFRIAFHEEKHLEITSYLLYNKHTVSGLHIIVKNITDRVKLEKALEAAQLSGNAALFQVQHLIDAIPLMIYIKDLEGRYVTVNRTFLHYINRRPEEVIGKTIFEVYGHDPSFLKTYMEADTKVIQTLEPLEMENVFNGPWGKTHVFTVKFPFFDQQGRLTGVAAITKDNTDAVNYREMLETSSSQAFTMMEQLKNFTRHITHDIRTPLKGVASITAQLLQTPLSPEQQTFIHQLDETIRHASETADEMIQLSNDLPENTLKEKHPVCIRKITEELAGRFNMLAEGRALNVHTVIHPSVPKAVRGHRQQTAQALQILLAQASRLTKEGYIQLEVRLEQMERNNKAVLRFTVAYTGGQQSGMLVEASLGWALAQKIVQSVEGTLRFAGNEHPVPAFELLLPFELLEQ
ncbi:MAG: PAS domain-containing protein [Chitinophagaceae bacterium]